MIPTTQTRSNTLATLRAKVKELATTKQYDSLDDDRFWKLEKGTSSAIIRFLPAFKGEAFPFAKIFTHGFQGQRWFIENCPTSLDLDCPACKANGILWNLNGTEATVTANRKIASGRKRRLSFISNILVVKDVKHPEHESKVFLFKYGKKIFDMICSKLEPVQDGLAEIEPIDPFDLEFGVNFRLRSTIKDTFVNYDGSTWDAPSKILAEPLYSLDEILDPKHFKSFDELKRRFDAATGAASTELVSQPRRAKLSAVEEIEPTETVAEPKPKKANAKPTVVPVAAVPDEDPQGQEYFDGLAAMQQDD